MFQHQIKTNDQCFTSDDVRNTTEISCDMFLWNKDFVFTTLVVSLTGERNENNEKLRDKHTGIKFQY